MHTPSKKILFIFSVGMLGVSIMAGILLSPMAGIVVASGTTVAGLFWSILSLVYDTRAELQAGLEQLAIEIEKTKDKFAISAGLPFVARYLELQGDNCPLFKRAADEIYHGALSGFDLLHRHELRTTKLEEVYHWLEFLFRDFAPLREIKAISSGEFNEWRATDSWWIKHYLQLHQIAAERDVKVERIFILKGKHQEKTYEDIFQRNAKYQVHVRLALRDRISSADHQLGNCMLFYAEAKEPVYALVAHHNSHGGAEEIIIYRDPQRVRQIAETYSRIASAARPYLTTNAISLGQSSVAVPRKSA